MGDPAGAVHRRGDPHRGGQHRFRGHGRVRERAVDGVVHGGQAPCRGGVGEGTGRAPQDAAPQVRHHGGGLGLADVHAHHEARPVPEPEAAGGPADLGVGGPLELLDPAHPQQVVAHGDDGGAHQAGGGDELRDGDDARLAHHLQDRDRVGPAQQLRRCSRTTHLNPLTLPNCDPHNSPDNKSKPCIYRTRSAGPPVARRRPARGEP